MTDKTTRWGEISTEQYEERSAKERHGSYEELGLPMGITDYELKKVLPTKAQLAKCVADAERQIAQERTQ